MYDRYNINIKRSIDHSRKHLRNKERIYALSLAKECYSMKLDLLTNTTIVDNVIRFVSQSSKDKLKIIYQ